MFKVFAEMLWSNWNWKKVVFCCLRFDSPGMTLRQRFKSMQFIWEVSEAPPRGKGKEDKRERQPVKGVFLNQLQMTTDTYAQAYGEIMRNSWECEPHRYPLDCISLWSRTPLRTGDPHIPGLPGPDGFWRKLSCKEMGLMAVGGWPWKGLRDKSRILTVSAIFTGINGNNGLERRGETGFEHWGNHCLWRPGFTVDDTQARTRRLSYVRSSKECGSIDIGKKVPAEASWRWKVVWSLRLQAVMAAPSLDAHCSSRHMLAADHVGSSNDRQSLFLCHEDLIPPQGSFQKNWKCCESTCPSSAHQQAWGFHRRSPARFVKDKTGSIVGEVGIGVVGVTTSKVVLI